LGMELFIINYKNNHYDRMSFQNCRKL
jgi:hypothetical protein